MNEEPETKSTGDFGAGGTGLSGHSDQKFSYLQASDGSRLAVVDCSDADGRRQIEPEAGKLESTADAPQATKRILVWLGAIAAVLGAAGVTLDKGEHFTKSLQSIFRGSQDTEKTLMPSNTSSANKLDTSSPQFKPERSPYYSDSTQEALGNSAGGLRFLTGKWVTVSFGSSVGEPIIFSKNFLGWDAWISNIGQTTIAQSDGHAGSNIKLGARDLDCYYYVSLIGRDEMVWALRAGKKKCPASGDFKRVQ